MLLIKPGNFLAFIIKQRFECYIRHFQWNRYSGECFAIVSSVWVVFSMYRCKKCQIARWKAGNKVWFMEQTVGESENRQLHDEWNN